MNGKELFLWGGVCLGLALLVAVFVALVVARDKYGEVREKYGDKRR